VDESMSDAILAGRVYNSRVFKCMSRD